MFTAFHYWMMRYRRIWRGTIVISVANPLIFLAGLGIGLGHLINQHAGSHVISGSYAASFAPGLLAASAMQTAFLEASRPVMSAAGRDGAYRSATTSPLSTVQILGGHLLFIAFRIVSSNAAFVVLLVAFGICRPWQALWLFAASVLVGMAFAAPVAAWAVQTRRTQSIYNVFRFVIMPMYMFSGTFFAISTLPGWLRFLVELTPLWHGTALCRSLASGSATFTGTVTHSLVLLILTIGGLLVARRTYARSLQP
jgi:ABC-type polysaccharide/polyol phosphate export permease